MVGESETGATTQRPYAEWVSDLKRLDPEAWDVLLRNYAGDLRHDITASLRKRGLPDELADDIEQETWLTAVRKMGEFVWESEDRFYHWLRAISLNHIRTYRRTFDRRVSVEDFVSDDADDDLEQFLAEWGATNGDSVEETVVLRQQLAALDQAMRTLKPQEREILMRWLMGETPRELAPTYQMKPRSISMLLLRAKDKIEAQIVYLQSLRAKDRPDA